MPYPEFLSWQAFYVIEPWGWHDAEFRTSALLAMLHNTSVSKKSKAKKRETFARNLQTAALKQFKQKRKKSNERDHYESLPPEEKKKFAFTKLKQIFPSAIVKKIRQKKKKGR